MYMYIIVSCWFSVTKTLGLNPKSVRVFFIGCVARACIVFVVVILHLQLVCVTWWYRSVSCGMLLSPGLSRPSPW